MTMIFFECGCCGHYHREDFYGDCRDDFNRYTEDEAKNMSLAETGELPRIIDLEEQMESEEGLRK